MFCWLCVWSLDVWFVLRYTRSHRHGGTHIRRHSHAIISFDVDWMRIGTSVCSIGNASDARGIDVSIVCVPWWLYRHIRSHGMLLLVVLENGRSLPFFIHSLLHFQHHTTTTLPYRLLPREEPEASEALEQVFQKEGIIRKLASVTSVKPSGSKGGHEATVTSSNGSTTETIKGDTLLVAVGRIPNVKGFGLDEIGVELNEKGGIAVNEKLQTKVKNVYAAGDCTGDLQFTHYAGWQGAIAARNILLPLKDQGVIENVPSATFTSPEVSSIGLTERKARDEYGNNNVAVAFQKMSHVDRAICDGEEDGFIKVIYSTRNYQILGATVMSPAAGELISEIGVAMKAKMSFDQLATVIHSYPTYSIALQMMASEVNYEKTLKSKTLLNILKWLGL